MSTPEMNGGAGQGTPNSKTNLHADDIAEDLESRQARSLRRQFAIGYFLAASLVPIIWGAGPR